MRLRLVVVLVAALAAAGCLQGSEQAQPVGGPAAPQEPVPGDEEGTRRPLLAQGSHSGVSDFRTVVVHDAEAFQALWDQHKAASLGGDEVPPEVDWGRETVAGVFLGDQPNACYGVEFDDVVPSPTNDTLVVTWHRVTPGPQQMCAQVVTQPFVLVGLEGTGLRVSFQELDAQESGSGGA